MPEKSSHARSSTILALLSSKYTKCKNSSRKKEALHLKESNLGVHREIKGMEKNHVI